MDIKNRYYMNLPEGIKKGINDCPLIIGIGPSAWPRIITSYYFPKYKTICLNDSQDDEFVRKEGIEVFSLKKEKPDLEISPQTPGRILDTDLVKEYVGKFKEPFSYLVYKSSSVLEKVCEQNGWNFIGNKKSFMDIYENKKMFKEILHEIGVEAIPGENLLIDDLTDNKFLEYQEKLGQENLVLQLAEMTYGGGSGTFYIDNVGDLKIFRDRVAQIREKFVGKKKKIETVNVAPFIQGVSSSISCCSTFKGTLTGPIQTQIIDIPEVASKEPGRSGTYAGTDWGYKAYSQASQKQADTIARKFGEYIYKAGYRGIFGIDLIVEESGKVWPVECNPRDTDAFPMVSMLMMDTGTVPLDVFHNLEHLGVDYDFDFEGVNDRYKKQVFNASQIIIENNIPSACYIAGFMKAGVYSFDGENLNYLKEGYSLFDLENEKQILITEGVPKNFTERGYSSSGRIFRVIKRGKMLEEPGKLTQEMKQIVKEIYTKLKLRPVPNGLVSVNGITSLFINRPSQVEDYQADLEKVDLINVIGTQGSGIKRPMKVAWRKRLEPSKDVLSQIPSTKTRKHIKYDLVKLKELGMEIKIYPEITGEQFQKWYKLYQKLIGEKSKGELVITEKWFEGKVSGGKKIGAVFTEKNGLILGGDIFFEVGKRLSVGYGIAEKIKELRGGLMLLSDYSFLEYACKSGYREVSFGQDTNLYGNELSTGLISYKTKLGFYPVAANRTYWLGTHFKSLEKFSSDVVFFAGDGEKLNKLVIIGDFETKNEIRLPQGFEMLTYDKKDSFLDNFTSTK